MEITRNLDESNPGPAEWFTGEVRIDTIASPRPPARAAAAYVHFAPGARTAWHTHPFGQTIYVTEGVCRCQRRGGPVEEVQTGDRVVFEPGEDHWHGAAPDTAMTHLAIQEADESGSPVTWGDHVTDEEYGST
jgi:quercetin dioxygenase-like cupin family protein